MISRSGHIFLTILIIILFTGIDLRSQSSHPAYNFKHLNVQNGLVYNIVYHFLQDSRGYMWIGTHNGLSLYDGTRTIHFLPDEKVAGSISGYFINSIVEDSAQRIWIGSQSGIDRYNRATNSFTHFGVDRSDGTKENTYCVALGFISADELWFLETKTSSVRCLNVNTGKTSFIANINATHAQLYKGSGETVHIWSAYDKGTIHQVYRNARLISQQIYFDGKDGPLNTPVLEVMHILQQNDTTVWLSTNRGLVKLNPILNKYSLFSQWQNQDVKELRYAALSSKEQLWVGTGPAGIYVFDIKTSRFIENYRNDNLNPFSICSDNIVSLYFDKTGNFWCGSYGNGASYTHTENKFFSTHISKNDVQPWNGNNYIHWFGYDPDKNIWCMFDNIPGFLVLDKNLQPKKYRMPVFENGTVFNQSMYKLLFDSPTEAWCTTNKGLYLYNLYTNKLREVKYELLSDEVQGSIWIKDITRLKDGSILFSTFKGLYRLTKENGKHMVNPIKFLKPGAYTGCGALFQDESGLIYVKSLVDSLYILKPGLQGKGYELLKEIQFSPMINHYYSEKNDSLIYLATSDGLYQINKQNFQIRKKVFDNKIPSLDISSVFKKDDRFWIFGKKGLSYFNKKNNEARTFTVEDGLPANEFTLSGLVITPDGRCIAGSSNGLVSFYHQQKPNPVYPARPRLTNIYINDTAYTAIINPDETKKIHLSHRENTFSFNFSPITFQHAAECSFEYQLEGYDETWVKSGAGPYTRYSKIPPGNYVFNLRVIDARGVASPFTKTLEIQIARAFWQTNFFIIAALAFMSLAGGLFLKWYFSYKIMKQKQEFEKQQAIEKERTRIATDMHDDLGAGLSRIKFISQSITNKKMDENIIKTELEKITGYSDEMSEKMGEIVWALNEKNDTLADLVAYCRFYTIEYLSNHTISCKADTPLGLPGTFIAGEIRRNIFLSVKECLHNIVKHSGASSVKFSVELSSMIKITIHDDGKGIDWNTIRAFSNGIQNIKNRMKDVNGEVIFSNENGTKVVLTIPL